MLCKHGHEKTEANTYTNPRGHSECRICRKKSRDAYISRMDAKKLKSNKARYADNLYFSGNREKAIMRDGGKCISCGITREEHIRKYGFDITVDHIDGNGRYNDKSLRNSILENLQTLCVSCHGKKDGGRHGINARKVEL